MWLLLFLMVFWRVFKLKSSNFLNIRLMSLGKAKLCFLLTFEPSSSMQVEVLLLILSDNRIKDIHGMRLTSCQTAVDPCFKLA